MSTRSLFFRVMRKASPSTFQTMQQSDVLAFWEIDSYSPGNNLLKRITCPKAT